MRQPKVTDFISGKVEYDKDGQYFWITDSKGGVQMLGELRGWGRIQNMISDMELAGKFQDEVGEWVADAINQKLTQEGNKI
jgi:hypothetical protein